MSTGENGPRNSEKSENGNPWDTLSGTENPAENGGAENGGAENGGAKNPAEGQAENPAENGGAENGGAGNSGGENGGTENPAENGGAKDSEGDPAEGNGTPEAGTTEAAEAAEAEAKERIKEKKKIIALYSLYEAANAYEEFGGNSSDYFFGDDLPLEHKEGESAEDAAKVTYDQLIDKLKEKYGDRTQAAGNGGGAEGGNNGAEGNGENGGVAGAVSTGEGGNGAGNNGENGGTNGTQAEAAVARAERHEKRKGRGFLKKAGVALLLAASIMGIFGTGAKKSNERQYVPDASMRAEEAMEEEDNFEILAQNEAYRGYFANLDNNGYNEVKNGRYNFSMSLAKYREQQGDRVKDMSDADLMKEYIGEHVSQMSEALPFYIVNLPSVIDQVDALRDARAQKGSDLTVAEINNIVENNDEAREQAIKAFNEWLKNAEAEDVVLNGDYYNCYMRNNKGEGQDFAHEDIEGVICMTHEVNAGAIAFHNGDESVTAKKKCTQPVVKDKLSGVTEINPGENPQTSDSDPGDTGGDTDPDSDPGDTGKTPEPTDSLESKDSKKEKLPDGHEWGKEGLGTVTSETKIPDNYNPDEGTFVDSGKQPGTSKGDVNPAGDVQEGAVDAGKTESADGSGRTIKEVIDQADDSTTTGDGEIVSEQTNGDTVHEQIHSQEQVKQQGQADRSYQESKADQEKVNREYGGDNGVIDTKEENAGAFNNGEY